MSPEDIKKLLGGYATGTLTAEEQEALFAAALEDQELFDALAREQSLRDLLRDPAARAELLRALDTPAGRSAGFWQWLRRPMVAGLAVAAVAEIALVTVAVWKGTHLAPVKQAAPAIMAEVKRPDAVLELAERPANSPAGQAKPRAKVADAPVAARAEKKAAPVQPATPSAEPEAGARAKDADAPGQAAADKARVLDATASLRKDQVVATGVAPPPPPAAPAAPVLMARKAEADSLAAGQPLGVTSGAVQKEAALDARAIFYANQPAPRANAFVAPGGGGGGAPPVRPTPKAEANTRDAKATPRLGVRISILRGDREADLTTVLDRGEAVRLRVTPNADGFLYVQEEMGLSMSTLASGFAQRLKPFETPELRFTGSGKTLYVTLSTSPSSVNASSLFPQPRDRVVDTPAGQEHATYFVNSPRAADAPQLVVPVTLTYR